MRCVLSRVVLTAFVFASTAHGAAASGVRLGAGDPFTVSGVKVDATAPSPAAARDLAMKQGLSLAWKTLFGRLAGQSAPGTEPKLADRELMALILRSEAGNERRNTTRYVADVTFHFNPAAVRQAMSRSTMIFADEGEAFDTRPLPALYHPSTYLAVTVRLDTVEDWTTLRARLGATKAVTGIDLVGFTGQEAQIYLNYAGDFDGLQAALAEHAVKLSPNEGQYALALGSASPLTTTASLQ